MVRSASSTLSRASSFVLPAVITPGSPGIVSEPPSLRLLVGDGEFELVLARHLAPLVSLGMTSRRARHPGRSRETGRWRTLPRCA